MTEHVKSKDRDPDKDKQLAELDRALMDTFPASDPPASTQPRSHVGVPDEGALGRDSFIPKRGKKRRLTFGV